MSVVTLIWSFCKLILITLHADNVMWRARFLVKCLTVLTSFIILIILPGDRSYPHVEYIELIINICVVMKEGEKDVPKACVCCSRWLLCSGLTRGLTDREIIFSGGAFGGMMVIISANKEDACDPLLLAQTSSEFILFFLLVHKCSWLKVDCLFSSSLNRVIISQSQAQWHVTKIFQSPSVMKH